MAPIRTMKVKRPLRRQRNMFGARMGIMWEEQLVDPPIDCIIPGINEEGSTPHREA